MTPEATEAMAGSAASGADVVVLGEGIHKWFRKVHVLDDVSFEVCNGEVVVIIGPSGSGKTTLLRCMNHLERIDRGRLLVNGHPIGYREDSKGRLVDESEAEIARQRQEIGFVFQQFNLLPTLNARHNVELPLTYAGVERGERYRRSTRALERVGLSDRMDHRPGELSGGQQQRVAIARALVTDPALILADEPTGNLDSVAADEVLGLFRDLHRSGRTVVLITHEPDVAEAAERTVRIRDGNVVDHVMVKEAEP